MRQIITILLLIFALNSYSQKNLYFLPNKIEIIEGSDVAVTIQYDLDKLGSFENIKMGAMTSHILRDKNLKVISETLKSGNDQTIIKYNYLSGGLIQIQLYDGKNLINSIENKFNVNNDFSFDGHYDFKYEYDNNGNWISKTGFSNNRVEIEYKRVIEYY